MKKAKKIFVVLMAMLMLMLLAGTACSADEASPTESTIVIIDAFGEEISLDKPAEKIISTYSAITENIFALGAGDKLIGVGTSEAYPPEALELPVFSYSKDDVEKFIAAKPDVIFFRSSVAKKYEDLITNLNSTGIITIAIDNEGFDEYVMTIAKVVGKEDVAEDMLKEFNDKKKKLEERASKVPENEKVSVFFESRQKEYRTPSSKSIVYVGLQLIGATNIAEENMEKDALSTIAYFGEEYLLQEADSIDVYIAQHGAMNKDASAESIKERPGFDVIKAIKEDEILIIEEKLISSPTFRQLEGLVQIFEYLYPGY